ncbi:hypothetical protein BCV71DRAFT_91764 [Rhizopus microsporus]|uniref:Uncharacterized protein n=1 Tax=Rhizopus microsporus TaxID=58291 RepID=A0A1X0RKA5_RHIZD|nr:hypothetical protein BCV71DRAFT_91764 [Rhizopus microsporus]
MLLVYLLLAGVVSVYLHRLLCPLLYLFVLLLIVVVLIAEYRPLIATGFFEYSFHTFQRLIYNDESEYFNEFPNLISLLEVL